MPPLRDSVPRHTTPVVTIGLIVATALVWFREAGAAERARRPLPGLVRT